MGEGEEYLLLLLLLGCGKVDRLGGHTTIKLEQVRNVQGKPHNLYAMLLILLPCLISNPCSHPDLLNRRKVCYESGSCGCAGNWLASIPSCCLNYL